MIIKMLSCKRRQDIDRLVDYVLSDKDRITDINETFFIAQNMYAREAEGFKKAFYENDAFRKKRKNGVVLYHEVLSFSSQDKVSLHALEDLTHKYIELRAKDAVVLAKPHVEGGHTHVHILISGTACCSAKVMRMSHKAFEQLRVDVERYQQEKYPHLRHSLVHLNSREKSQEKQQKRDRNRRHERKVQVQKRRGTSQPLYKDRLMKAVQQMYERSTDVKSFLSLINAQSELECYFYREKLAGVKYRGKSGKQRKYRFKTLGITKEMLLSLKRGEKQKKQKTHSQKAPTFFGSILRNSELERYLQQIRQKEQDKTIAEWKELCQGISLLSGKKQDKAMKRFLSRLLLESKTMKQFLYFLGRIGLQKQLVDQKLLGVRHGGKTYNFKALGLAKELKEKQQAFERYQKRVEKQKREQKGKSLSQAVEIDVYMGGMFLF